MNRYESTTEYYGNHEPYVTKKPRSRRNRREAIQILVPVVAVLAVYLVWQPFWPVFPDVESRSEAPPAETTRAVAEGEPINLNIGDSVDVDCSAHNLGQSVCMTVTLEDIQPEALCHGKEPKEGRFVQVTLSAITREDPDLFFHSPFLIPQWRAFTADGEASFAHSEYLCDSGVAELARAEETPGETVTGSYWLAVPHDATALEFTGYLYPLFRVPVAL